MLRYRRDNPCPICSGWDNMDRGQGERCFGFLSSNRAVAFCTREEHAGRLSLDPNSNAYGHRMRGECSCGERHDGQQRETNRSREPRMNRPRRRTIECEYTYKDADGQILFQVLRMNPKSFLQRRPDGDGHWIWGMAGGNYVKTGNDDWKRIHGEVGRNAETCTFPACDYTLYNLPDLIAHPDQPIYLVEGEKDVEKLKELGVLATTAPGGAGKWKATYTELLVSRSVVILPDLNDSVDKPSNHNDYRKGEKHAEAVAARLHAGNATVRVLKLPGLDGIDGADVSDWLDADEGNTADRLRELADSCSTWEPPPPGEGGEPPPLAGAASRTSYNRTDRGNAQRLSDMFKHEVLCCNELTGWLMWSGRVWEGDRTGEIFRRARQVVDAMFTEASERGDESGEELFKWAIRSESSQRLMAMVTVASTEGDLVCLPDLFDSDPWLLNCQNGVVNLENGEFVEHRPDQYMTKKCPVDYVEGARSQMWDDFLVRTIPDEALRRFVKRSAGYSLTGFTSEEKMFFVHGRGATGKSTFLSAMLGVMGTYSKTVDFETFLRHRDVGGPRNDIAALKGARFVASAEVEEGRRLAEATVKSLVSGDKVSARFLHKEFFEFSPICKLWLVANDKPRIRDDDDAIWRRILQIPFDEVIPEAERDPTVKDILTDLSQSGSAILNWLLEGVREWRESGLGIPPAVREATAEFRRDMDPLVEWMQECVEIDPAGNATETNSDAWQSYQKWCDDNGIRHSIGRRTFSTRLRQRFEQGRDGRTRFWIGFSLVSESQEGARYEWGPSRDDEYE